MNVLLIEPDVVIAQNAYRVLRSAGHTVVLTDDAEAAIHLSDRQVPDVVILELQLAGHNGIEFVHEFRSYPEWQAIPIILFTLVPPQALVLAPEMAQTMNITHYLYKPMTSLKRLIDTVASLPRLLRV
jgi:CheY-like chemotaxis protein